MEKAYDIKALGLKLKDKGLDVAEEAAKVAVVAVLEWVEESAKLSDNKYDDLVSAVLPIVKDKVLELVDKVDGQVG